MLCFAGTPFPCNTAAVYENSSIIPVLGGVTDNLVANSRQLLHSTSAPAIDLRAGRERSNSPVIERTHNDGTPDETTAVTNFSWTHLEDAADVRDDGRERSDGAGAGGYDAAGVGVVGF